MTILTAAWAVLPTVLTAARTPLLTVLTAAWALLLTVLTAAWTLLLTILTAARALLQGPLPLAVRMPPQAMIPTASDPSAPSGSLNGSDSSQDGTSLTGAVLNGSSQASQRVSLTEDFYYEPLSDNLRRYITGVSYPAVQSEDEAAALAVDYDDLRYVHVLHYDFEGNPTEGELICNEYIAQDLVEIFHELYYSEYQIERMVLIDEYDGDDTASMEDNNTSCFNYRVVEGSESLSKHAYGLAIDINPFYNPYVTYDKDGSERVSPVAAQGYADRSVSFPYKIDEEDLCCRLFKEHGFIWGGNWNSLKDYQHFQKTPK